MLEFISLSLFNKSLIMKLYILLIDNYLLFLFPFINLKHIYGLNSYYEKRSSLIFSIFSIFEERKVKIFTNAFSIFIYINYFIKL